jgi:hypothetical protein
MNTNKVTFAALAAIAVATSLAVLPAALANQALAFPGENGQGHKRTEECTQTQSGGTTTGDCPGSSEKSPNKEECTTTFAGKSSNIKDQTCV